MHISFYLQSCICICILYVFVMFCLVYLYIVCTVMYCLKRYFVYVFVLYMYLYCICICIVVCTQLLVNSRVEDECYPTYISLIDKCMHHEAFTVKQRKLLQEWRSQVLQRNNSRMITGRQEQRIPLHRPTGCVLSYNLCAPLTMEQIAWWC